MYTTNRLLKQRCRQSFCWFTRLLTFVYSQHFTPHFAVACCTLWMMHSTCQQQHSSSSSNIYSSNIYRSSNIYSNFSLRYNLQLNYFDLVSWLPQWVFIVWLISALRLPLLHGSLAGTCRQWVNIALTDLKTLANRYGHCCQNGLIVVCLFGLEMLQLAYLHSWVFGWKIIVHGCDTIWCSWTSKILTAIRAKTFCF